MVYQWAVTCQLNQRRGKYVLQHGVEVVHSRRPHSGAGNSCLRLVLPDILGPNNGGAPPGATQADIILASGSGSQLCLSAIMLIQAVVGRDARRQFRPDRQLTRAMVKLRRRLAMGLSTRPGRLTGFQVRFR